MLKQDDGITGNMLLLYTITLPVNRWLEWRFYFLIVNLLSKFAVPKLCPSGSKIATFLAG